MDSARPGRTQARQSIPRGLTTPCHSPRPHCPVCACPPWARSASRLSAIDQVEESDSLDSPLAGCRIHTEVPEPPGSGDGRGLGHARPSAWARWQGGLSAQACCCHSDGSCLPDAQQRTSCQNKGLAGEQQTTARLHAHQGDCPTYPLCLGPVRVAGACPRARAALPETSAAQA